MAVLRGKKRVGGILNDRNGNSFSGWVLLDADNVPNSISINKLKVAILSNNKASMILAIK